MGQSHLEQMYAFPFATAVWWSEVKSRPDSWQDMKQRDVGITLKKKKKAPVGNSVRSKSSSKCLGHFSWKVRQRQTQDRCNPHPPSAIRVPHMSESKLSSLRAILKAVNVLAMRKQKIYIGHSNMWRPDRAERLYGSLTSACFSLGGLGMAGGLASLGRGERCLNLPGDRPLLLI